MVGAAAISARVLFDYQPAPPLESSSMKNAGAWLCVRLNKHHYCKAEGKGLFVQGARAKPLAVSQAGGNPEHRDRLWGRGAATVLLQLAPVRKGWMGWDRHVCMGRGRATNQGMQRLLHISIFIFLFLFKSIYSASVSEMPMTQVPVCSDPRQCKLAVPKGRVTHGRQEQRSAMALPCS